MPEKREIIVVKSVIRNFQLCLWILILGCLPLFSQENPAEKRKEISKFKKQLPNNEEIKPKPNVETENLKDKLNLDQTNPTIESTQTETKNPKEQEQEIKIDPKKMDLKIPLELGVFVDGYYNANLNKPSATSQNYSTQAIQNDTFAINLAHVEAKLDAEKFRGRLALQSGTSVNVNYANETTNQKYSNQNSVRNIQEAYVGVKLGKKTWLDAGIYLGNIGFESWISGYNWNYTRSFASEHTPYYSTGVRLSHEFTDKLSAQLHIMNGWQNITDNNKDKSIGIQLTYNFLERMKFIYNNFIGNETTAPTKTDKIGTVYMYSRGDFKNHTIPYTPYTRNTRYYHNFIYQYDITDKFSIASSFNVGFQIRGTSNKYNPTIPQEVNPNYPYYNKHSSAFRQWYNGTFWIVYRIFPEWRIATRIERYLDKEETNIPIVKQSTIYQKKPGKKPNGFQVSAISLNLDFIPNEYAMIRFELKYRRSMDPIFDYADSTELSRHEKMFVSAMSFKY